MTEGDRIWFNTQQAADYAGCHVQTTRKALEAGELHGAQRKKNGRWRIHVDVSTPGAVAGSARIERRLGDGLPAG